MSDQEEPKSNRINITEEGTRYPLEKMTKQNRTVRHSGRQMLEKSGRVPPQAMEVEQSVLGAMLIEKTAIPKAIEILAADAFYQTKHEIIYSAILSLFERVHMLSEL